MILNSPIISGSLTVTGNIIASGSITLSGSIASSSYANNATSASYAVNATTASYAIAATSASYAVATTSASYAASSTSASFASNAQSASNAVAAQTASYADALTVAGTLTAQTLVVQTITSSVDFVTGSTRFGSLLGNTHVFTGSVSMTGSLAVVTTGTEFQVGASGVTLGNAITDTHNITGSVGISGSATFVSSVTATQGNFFQTAASGFGVTFKNRNANQQWGLTVDVNTVDDKYLGLYDLTNSAYRVVFTNTGKVGIGNTTPLSPLHIGAALVSSGDAAAITLKQTGTNETTGIYLERSGERKGYAIYVGGGLDSLVFQRNNTGTKSDVMTLTRDGLVGIGNQSPTTKLVVNNAIVGAILPYINATSLSYNSEGISVAGSNTNNTNVGNGLTLYNNVASVGAYSPVIAFSSMTSGGAYNATYAFITGIYQGAGGDSNWAKGALMFGTGASYGATERMRITDGGDLFIANTDNQVGASSGLGGWSYSANSYQAVATNSGVSLYLNRINDDGAILVFRKNGTNVGSISTNSNSLPSDLNFKKNINNLDLGLNLVTKLRAVSYNHKIDDEGASLSTGFIAQELEQSLTELGVEENKYHILQHTPNEDETQSQYWLDYTKMVPVLVKAIQELKAQNDDLQSQINELKA